MRMRQIAGRRFRCELLSWEAVARDARKLARLIKDSGFAPDIIVAIARGGLVPARLLSDYLHKKNLATMKVEHWGITATPDRKAVIKYPLNADITKKAVLLVDDITDTGDTLSISVAYLRTLKPHAIRTATLLHKTTSKTVPDFFVRTITRWRWVIFPWHVWEDATFLMQQITADGLRSVSAIRRELSHRYRLDLPPHTIRGVLSNLRSRES